MQRMNLDPQAQAVLQAMSSEAPLDFDHLDAAVLRKASAGPSPFAPGDAVHGIEDIVIDGPGGALRLRIYRPHTTHALPVILFFHGGGFVICSPETHDNICRCLAARAECVVVSVDYRLAPEAPYPAAVEDACAALDWLSRDAATIGGDAQRLALAGDSVGGTLTAVVAQHAAASGLRLRHQLLLYPLTDWRFETASWAALGEWYPGKALMGWFRQQYLRNDAERDEPKAAPLRAASLRGVAPATVFTAEFDPLRDDGAAYAERLRADGVDVEQYCWPGQIHGFASMLGAIDAADAALDHAARRLREALD